MDKKELRRQILKVSHAAKACHIGSSLSCADIMHDLFYHVLTERDRFIFSKASGSATYYIILADKGYFPKEKLAEYLHDYPEASKEVPGVLHSVGSVGHGLAVAVGLALADRTRKVYCLVSDGELQEGVTWESLLFARQHHLSNLIVIVDRNGIQACGPTEDIMSLEPLKAKFRAFDWCATSLDGHDSKQLLWALKKPNLHGPYAIIAETVKGKGVDFMENDYRWHYKNLDDELLEQALCQI